MAGISLSPFVSCFSVENLQVPSLTGTIPYNSEVAKLGHIKVFV